MHTIKGTCGFLGLPRLEAIAHAGENVLGKFRDDKLPVTPEAVTSILKCIDTIRSLLAHLEQTGSEAEADDSALIEELNAVAEGRSAQSMVAGAVEATSSAEPVADFPVMSTQSFPVAAELLEEVARAEAAGFKAATDVEIAMEMEAERAQSRVDEATAARATPRVELETATKSGSDVAGSKEPAVSPHFSQSSRIRA